MSCPNLQEVELNDGLVTIEMNAFGFCPSLKSLYVPSSVTDTTAGKLGTNMDCTIYGEKGSFIEKEIKENGEEYLLTFEER